VLGWEARPKFDELVEMIVRANMDALYGRTTRR
jgi:hypothetical protein